MPPRHKSGFPLAEVWLRNSQQRVFVSVSRKSCSFTKSSKRASTPVGSISCRGRGDGEGDGDGDGEGDGTDTTGSHACRLVRWNTNTEPMDVQ